MKFESTHLKDFSSLVNDLIKTNHNVILKTSGESMYPQIATGDTVEISPLNKGSLNTGDIVVYRSGTVFVCHRLTEKYSRGKTLTCRTRGDAHINEDPEFPCKNIIGKVIHIRKRKTGLHESSLLTISNFLLRFGRLHARFFSLFLLIKKQLKKSIQPI